MCLTSFRKPVQCKDKVCQVTARHGSHAALNTARQVSVVMGMTWLCLDTLLARQPPTSLARLRLRTDRRGSELTRPKSVHLCCNILFVQLFFKFFLWTLCEICQLYQVFMTCAISLNINCILGEVDNWHVWCKHHGFNSHFLTGLSVTVLCGS